MKKLIFGIFALAAAPMIISTHALAENAIQANSESGGQKYNIVVRYIQSAAFLKDDDSEKYLEAILEFPRFGGETVKSVSYRYTINGKTTTRDTTVRDYYPFFHPDLKCTIKLPFDNVSEPGSYKMEFELFKVNSSDYTGDYGKAIGYVDILEKKPLCRPLCEMILSAKDYSAPSALNKFETTKNYLDSKSEEIEYPFIGVIYHYDDPMQIAESKELPIPCAWDGTQLSVLYWDSIPCSFDRTITEMGHSYLTDNGMFHKYVSYYKNRVTPIGVSVKAQYVAADVCDININTKVNFFCTRKKANYKLGYIVKGDGLTGDGDEWALHNGYTNTDIRVGSFNDLPPIIYNYIYNDVALVTKYINGVDDSLPSEISSGDEVNVSFTIPASDINNICNLSGELLPVNYNNLQVISFVIDSDSGEIVNSNSSYVGKPAGLDEIEGAETVAVERFDINGNRVDENYKGLCIVRETKADGTVSSRKEMIR